MICLKTGLVTVYGVGGIRESVLFGVCQFNLGEIIYMTMLNKTLYLIRNRKNQKLMIHSLKYIHDNLVNPLHNIYSFKMFAKRIPPE